MWVLVSPIVVLLGLSLWHGQLWVAALSVLSLLPLLASMRVRVVGPEVHGSFLGIRIHRFEIAAIRELMFLTGHGFRVRTTGGWTWLFGSASNVVDARRELVRRLDATVLWHEAIGSLRPGESGFLPSAASLPAHIRGRPWWVLGVLAAVLAWSQQAWMHGVSAIALIVVGADVREVLATRDSERSGAQLVTAMEPTTAVSAPRPPPPK